MITSKDLAVFKCFSKTAGLAILDCVFFEKNRSTMTNLDMTISVAVDNDTTAIVPFSVVKKLKEFTFLDPATIVAGSRTLTLKDARPPEDFPKIRHVAKGRKIKLNSDALRRSLGYYSEDVSRPALNYIRLSSEGYVATDGHVLYWHRQTVKNIPELFLLPQAVRIALKVAKDEIISIRHDGEVITLIVGKYTISFKRSQETYPDIHSVIPVENDTTEVITEVPALLDKVNAMLPYSNSLTNCVAMRFKNGNLHLQVKGEEVVVNDRLPYNARVSGEVGFNINYLSKILLTSPLYFQTDEGKINPIAPMVSRTEDELVLVMPLRLAA